MNLNKEDLVSIALAVGKAMEAYREEIERDGTDPSFCPISITVHTLTIDFQEVGQIIYNEMDFRGGKGR